MNTYETIQVDIKGQVATIYLNRPEVHNAFNPLMVNELTSLLKFLENDSDLRVLLLRGNGRSFCSGADINWMKEVAEFDFEKNYKESLLMANCLQCLYHFPLPVISFVHGSVIGGGCGLTAAADIAVSISNTVFRFSEVTIGLVPAVISMFIARRMGLSKTKELMLTGQQFSGIEAERWGLVNYAVDEVQAEEFIDSFIHKLIKNSPLSLRSIKAFLNKSPLFNTEDEFLRESADLISKARISKDGQEGMKAFIEKRKPVW